MKIKDSKIKKAKNKHRKIMNATAEVRKLKIQKLRIIGMQYLFIILFKFKFNL